MRRLRTLLAALALAAAAAGCSGDGSDNATTVDLDQPPTYQDSGDAADLATGDGAGPGEAPNAGTGKADSDEKSEKKRKKREKHLGTGKKDDKDDDDEDDAEDEKGDDRDTGGEDRGQEVADRRAPRSGGVLTPQDAANGNPEAIELQRRLDRAKQTVRAVIEAVSAADADVCTELFTQRYVEARSGLEGDAAVQKCKLDIASSRGRVELTAFGPSRIEGGRKAFVKFNLRAGSRLTSEEYVLVLGKDNRWRVDEAL